MHRQICLIAILSIALVGVSFVGTSFAENTHIFDSQIGKYGISQPGSFLSPQHLAFDSENNLYVTDLGNARVQKFDSNGTFLSEWGSMGSSPGNFGNPSGIAISGEFVFVVDNRNHNVQKFDLDGNFITMWGSFGNDNGSFKSPRGITISDDQFIFVVDSGNARVQKFTFDGEYVSHFGQSGKRGGNFITPVDIAINSNKIFVTDSTHNRINIFNLDGTYIRTINDRVGGFEINPEGITFDEHGNFYISDYRNNRIIQYNEFGIALSVFGQTGIYDGQFKFPKDLAISNDGYLFVTDTQGHRVQKFSTPLVQETPSLIEEEIIVELETQPKTLIPNDFKKPTIMVPDDVLIEASGHLTSVNIGNAMATDENGILSLTHNAPSSFPLGINTIIWTAIDGAGNMAIASQTVTIQDTTSPQISSIDDISLEAKSDTQNMVYLTAPLVTDDLGVFSISNDAPEVFPLGETIVTWTATDIIGNSSFLTQSVYLTDSISPRIAFVDNVIIEATSLNENLVDLIIPESADDVGVFSISNDAPEVFPLGETIVTWTATDASGNTASSTQIISVIDTVSPTIEIFDYEIEANITNGSDMSLSLPAISEIQNVEISNDAPKVFPLGETIVTWTATDSSGNTASSTQIISVIDTTAPSIILPDNLEIEAESILTKIGELGEIISEDFSGISSISNDAPEVFPLGETIVTWTVTDNYENIISNQQIITVIDTSLPEITAPSDIHIEASNFDKNIIDLVGVRASDQVEISSISNDAPEVFPLGETIVTWTATDTSGNASTDSQKVFVEDTTSPSLITPSDIQMEILTITGMQIDLGLATSEDIVDSHPEISNDAPEVFPLGETIVTWTATDASGNTASSTQTISIIDTTSPVISESESIVIEATNQTDNIFELPLIESNDNTKITSISNDAPASFEFGTTIVTWIVFDISGNSSTSEQEVRVIDTTIPTIIVPTDIQVEATSMDANIIDFGFADASDQVEISSISNDAPEVFPLGETIVTWTATDSSGNTASSTQTISIIDTTSPQIEQPLDVTVDATSKSNNIVTLDSISVIESISDIKISNDAPLHYEFGETIVTWTATDASGNTASSTQIVNVVDTSSPLLNIPDNIITDAVDTTNFVEIGFASVEDIIDDSPMLTNDAPEVFPLGETIVTWTATDKFGNSSISSQIISVNACGNSPSYYNMIIGSEDDDLITGTTLPDLIFAKGGDDIISGNKSNDCILGGDGNDIIFGNGGNDNISGQGGNDIIKGHSGEDFIFGGLGLDMIDGGEDIDTCKIIDEQNSDIVIKCESNSSEN